MSIFDSRSDRDQVRLRSFSYAPTSGGSEPAPAYLLLETNEYLLNENTDFIGIEQIING